MVCPSSQFNMAHGSFCGLIPQVVTDNMTAHRLKRCCGNKVVGVGCHHHLHNRTGFYESAHKDRRFIRSDAPAYAKQNVFS
jgi:hypothetical protein